MVKCSSCGLEVLDDLENCPNCGNNLVKSEVVSENDSVDLKCGNCGASLSEDNSFCPSCGNPVEVKKDTTLKCKNCGSELPENILFCSVCGTKVEQVKRVDKKIVLIVELNLMQVPHFVMNVVLMYSQVKSKSRN